MKELTLTIKGTSGLHARPASQLVTAAQKFTATIEIKKADRKVNAKSLMSILSLGAVQGDSVTVFIDGSDEDLAAQEMTRLFEETLAHA